MANEIILAVGASAEPDTCGSCKFFKRQMDMGPQNMIYGICRFVLPRTVMAGYTPRVYSSDDDCETSGYMRDAERCDLQQPDGKAYIVQRRIPPER
jgi:hypothetical protein